MIASATALVPPSARESTTKRTGDTTVNVFHSFCFLFLILHSTFLFHRLRCVGDVRMLVTVRRYFIVRCASAEFVAARAD